MLGGGQLQVENQQIRPGILAQLPQLREAAAAQTGGLIRRFPLLNQGAQDLSAGGGRQLSQLLQRDIRVEFAGVHRHQHGFFQNLFPFRDGERGVAVCFQGIHPFPARKMESPAPIVVLYSRGLCIVHSSPAGRLEKFVSKNPTEICSVRGDVLQ